MSRYEVWMEGFQVMEGRAEAQCLGSCEAENFLEACKQVCKYDSNYDPIDNSIWGCRLFDNEKDARKSFG